MFAVFFAEAAKRIAAAAQKPNYIFRMIDNTGRMNANIFVAYAFFWHICLCECLTGLRQGS